MTSHPSPFRSAPQFSTLKRLVQGDGLQSLCGRHRIGRLVEQLIPSNRRSYGGREFIELTRAVGLPPGSNVLSQLRLFAKICRSADVRRLEKPLSGSTYKMTWSLVVRLISFPDDQRAQLTQECREGEWSVADLDRRIRQIRARRHKGGPRLKRPQGVVDGLLQAQVCTEDWIKRAEQLWIGGEEPVVTAESIRAGGAEAARIAQETSVMLERLQAAVASFQQVLQAAKSGSRRIPKR